MNTLRTKSHTVEGLARACNGGVGIGNLLGSIFSVDNSGRLLDACCVQAPWWSPKNNVNAISNTASVAGHVASRDAVEHLRRHCAAHHHQAEIHPVSLARLAGAFFLASFWRILNRADCVKAGCSLIRHADTRSVCPHGSAQRSMENTQNRIARKGAGDGRGRAEMPAHELPVNEAHTRSNAKAGRTPAFDGASWSERHKRTTSREPRIIGQAVWLRARAAGRKACPENGRCISSQPTPEIGTVSSSAWWPRADMSWSV